MKNHIKNALAILASTVCAVSLFVGSTPIAAQAADEVYTSWYYDDGDDWDYDYDDEYGEIYSPADIHINKGNSIGVDAAVYTNAYKWRVKWSVSGSAVSVSGASRDSANLYGQKAGTSTVTVTLYGSEGDVLDSDYFNVYVTDPTPSYVNVTGVSVNCTSLTLSPGETGRVRATVYPLDATNKDINWSSSDSNIASVDGDGVIRARKTGDVTIYARSAANGATGTCKVHVVKAGRVAVSGIAVDSHDVALKVGESRNVNVRITPANASNRKYSSATSNQNVAIVDGNGIIYAVGNGVCTVTYRSSEGDHVSQVSVRVYGGQTQSNVSQQTVQQAVQQAKQQQAATSTSSIGHDPNVQYGYLQKIAAAASGSTVILHTSAPSAYDVNVVNAIKARPDVKVIAEFPFQGYEFHMYMPPTFDCSQLYVGGYVDWLTLCNYQAQGITVSQIGPAQP